MRTRAVVACFLWLGAVAAPAEAGWREWAWEIFRQVSLYYGVDPEAPPQPKPPPTITPGGFLPEHPPKNPRYTFQPPKEIRK